jgi:transposase
MVKPLEGSCQTATQVKVLVRQAKLMVSCRLKFTGELRKTGAEVVVINPFDFRALYCTGKKTDRVDATKLAEYVYNRTHMTSTNMVDVYVPDRGMQTLRKTVSIYKYYSMLVVGCQNQLLSIFRSKCIVLTYDSYRKKRAKNQSHRRLDEFDRAQIKELGKTIEFLRQRKAELREEICLIGTRERRHELERLVSMQGISVFAAACIMADIIHIRRFRTAGKLCNYLSSVPKVDSSNTSVRIKGINKHGRKIAYNSILQGLNHMIDSSPHLKRFYEKKLKGKAACKVRAGAVRRVMVSIFYMLKNDEEYRFANTAIYQRKVKEIAKYSQAA